MQILAALLLAQVMTSSGPIEGTSMDGVNAFLGVPFAAPPAGALRFQPPRAPQPWTDVRPTKELPPKCPQKDGDTVVGSEDCLYLNVWSRAGATSSPVMVFVHGGGNVQGSTSERIAGQLLYDGSRIVAKKDVVVVTLQYRLGLLGNLALPDLTAESEHQSSGNYGLLDIIAGLQWVQANIRSFGGDPDRVLLFGESAGALNTCMLVASPLAQGLFTRALMESGGCPASTLDDHYRTGTDQAKAAGCETVECLRAAPVEALVNAIDGSAVHPDGTVARSVSATIDGWVLPALPAETIRQQKHNAVPFVIGTNANETAAFGIPPMTESAYRLNVLKVFGPVLGLAVLKEYPARNYPTPRDAMIAVTTDAQFTCPARSIARNITGAQSQPVFRYFFTDPPAVHGLELRNVFAFADSVLTDAVVGYWTSFAATGVPDAPGSPVWPSYDAAADGYLELASPITYGQGVRTPQCDFWENLAKSVP